MNSANSPHPSTPHRPHRQPCFIERRTCFCRGQPQEGPGPQKVYGPGERARNLSHEAALLDVGSGKDLFTNPYFARNFSAFPRDQSGGPMLPAHHRDGLKVIKTKRSMHRSSPMQTSIRLTANLLRSRSSRIDSADFGSFEAPPYRGRSPAS